MNDPLTVIRSNAKRYGLDPAAVVAYALTQGGTGWGAVGDNGTSFGPFQAHIGGAAGNRSAKEAAAWANSPQGLSEMMGMMSRAGASGRRGPDAAAYIVGPSFGRGANPPEDMRRARAAYQRAAQLVGGGSPPQPPPTPFPRGNGVPDASRVPQPGMTDPSARMALIQQVQKIGRGKFDLSNVLALMQQARAASPAPEASAPAATAAPPAGGAGSPIPAGPSLEAPPGEVDPSLIELAKGYGLKVTSGFRSVEKQARLYAGRSAPGSVGAPGKSYHNYGRAIDVAVDPAAMQFLAYAKKHPEQFREVFYDPAGWYIKNGRIVHGSIGGHSDHVHVAR